jgi:hypothetical protein
MDVMDCAEVDDAGALLAGIAVAVPQARWLGERIMQPYEMKFSRMAEGIRFLLQVPGGPHASGQGRRVTATASGAVLLTVSKAEAAAAGAAWQGLAVRMTVPFLEIARERD